MGQIAEKTNKIHLYDANERRASVIVSNSTFFDNVKEVGLVYNGEKLIIKKVYGMFGGKINKVQRHSNSKAWARISYPQGLESGDYECDEEESDDDQLVFYIKQVNS
jgi:glutathione synthase/RimK-type ligase-like ATP-grasp enzyme